MSKKTLNTLMAIASGALAIGRLILLLVSIFGETKDYWALNSAIAAICLANLFNLIRLQRKPREAQKENRDLKRKFLSILIVAVLCTLTACKNNPVTYTGGDTDIGGMFHDIFFGEEQEELSFTLDIKNDTSVKFYSAAISWYMDGEVVGSRGALDAADNYLLLPGQVVICKFLADDFPDGELSEVKIDVFVKEKPGDVDFVSCGTLIIPRPVYGQDYPVRLAEDEASDETYFLVSGDESLCLVETKRQVESQTAESIDLIGPWHLDETRNDLSSLTSTETAICIYANKKHE